MKITVKKVAFVAAEPETDVIENAFESEKIEWNPIACINWPEFPCTPEVSFRIMHSESEIYIQYKVRQQGARAVYDFDCDSQPWTDDCVEFFTTPSPTCGKYFNLEMNCIGHGIFCYGPDRFHRFSCDGPVVSRIRRHASLGSTPINLKGDVEWNLTVAIPKELYSVAGDEIPPFSGRTVPANFYKCGDNTDTPHYLSWNPISTPAPNFHCPEYFGELAFE